MQGRDIDAILRDGSISEIRAAYAAGRVSVRAATAWYLARIAAQGALNAVRETAPDALEQADAADAAFAAGIDRGPLHGIPVLLKDNIATGDGMRMAAGAAALAGFVPARAATVAVRLRAAGAIILGKTNMTEFADYVSDVMPSGFSGAGGVVRNPHGMEFGRGQGSSVGSAAAVAAGLAPVAIGSETQNSIQTPACFASVVGFKPSMGAVSRAGMMPLVPSQDSPGPLARSVADAALVFGALAGADPRDSVTLEHLVARSGPAVASLAGIRIGVPRRAMTDNPAVAALLPLFAGVLSRLAAAGAVIVDPCDLPSAEQLRDVRSTVFPTEFKAALNAFLADHGSPAGLRTIDDLLAWNAAHPETIPYGQSLLLAAAATAGLDDPRYLADRARDIVLSRSSGIDAALAAGGADVLIAPMTVAAKATGKAGAPVVALPAGLGPDGTPFGITLYAGRGADRRLLAIAALVETVTGPRVIPTL